MTNEERWPDAIATRMKSVGRIVFRGEEYRYAIMGRDACSDMPGFIGCLSEEGKNFFFVSEDVPEEFREFQLAHEIVEMTELGRDVPGSCLGALMQELAIVPQHMLKNYLPYRRDFFRRLVRYHEKISGSVFRSNISDSLFYLEEATRIR